MRRPQLEDVLPLMLTGPNFQGGKWTRYKHMRVYIRVSWRCFDGPRELCIDLANLATPEKYQRKGTFNALIATLRRYSTLPIYLENVLDPRWGARLETHGWQPLSGEVVRCYLMRGTPT